MNRKKPSEQYQKKYFYSKTVEPFITLNLINIKPGYQNVSEVFFYNITNVASSVKRNKYLRDLI